MNGCLKSCRNKKILTVYGKFFEVTLIGYVSVAPRFASRMSIPMRGSFVAAKRLSTSLKQCCIWLQLAIDACEIPNTFIKKKITTNWWSRGNFKFTPTNHWVNCPWHVSIWTILMRFNYSTEGSYNPQSIPYFTASIIVFMQNDLIVLALTWLVDTGRWAYFSLVSRRQALQRNKHNRAQVWSFCLFKHVTNTSLRTRRIFLWYFVFVPEILRYKNRQSM